jgi:flagellar basal-body rod protein FlgB
MVDRLEQHLSFYRTAANLRSHRQELLSSNIANADTPHFKARDMDFKAALSAALGGAAGGTAAPITLARTHASHIEADGVAPAPYDDAIKYRTEYQGAVDGNTVNMDVERAAFTENALQVEALITFINKRLSGMQTAIQGQ